MELYSAYAVIDPLRQYGKARSKVKIEMVKRLKSEKQRTPKFVILIRIGQYVARNGIEYLAPRVLCGQKTELGRTPVLASKTIRVDGRDYKKCWVFLSLDLQSTSKD